MDGPDSSRTQKTGSPGRSPLRHDRDTTNPWEEPAKSLKGR